MKPMIFLTRFMPAAVLLTASLLLAEQPPVSNKAQADKNFAEGKCVPNEGANQGIWPAPCNAFDGDLSSSTNQGKTWADLCLTVDFGKQETIDKVVIYYTQINPGDPDVGYMVMGSNDGSNWVNIQTVPSTQMVDSVENLNATYQYMRLQFPRFGYDPWWSHAVSEIQMWGKDESTTLARSPRSKASRALFPNGAARPGSSMINGRRLDANTRSSNGVVSFPNR